jgi:hypothetical protein
MQSVFIVQHLHLDPSNSENIKLIGVYRSLEAAHAAIDRLSIQPGFCNYPRLLNPLIDQDISGFYVDEYQLDQDQWTEGFISL